LTLQKVVWHLPRPGSLYKGSYPLHFEKKIKKYLQGHLLHLFCGSSKLGITSDIKFENKPNIVCDSHFLPFRDECFDSILADPPYSNELSEKLYGTSTIRTETWIKEAVRVLKKGGKIGVYHWYLSQRPKNCRWSMIIIILLRTLHKPRICAIFTKDTTKQTTLEEKSQ